MKRVARNGMIALAAATGAMAVTMPAHADSSADGTAVGSPGVISGDSVQLPVNVPVNLCGNTIDVIGVLNPAMGTTCANTSTGAASGAVGDAVTAHGEEVGSPGVISGNGVHLPVDLPVNVSGNSVNGVGALNPALGNTSVNTSGNTPGGEPATPAAPETPRSPVSPSTGHQGSTPASSAQPHAMTALAHTGTDYTVPALAGSAAMILGGAILFRRRPTR